MSEVGPSSPIGESPLTVPSSTTPTPEPLNRIQERKFWVELRHATSEERNYEEFHLNLREIAAEHFEGSRKFYYVLLGDDKYHKVRNPARDPINSDPSADAPRVQINAKVVREEYPELLDDFGMFLSHPLGRFLHRLTLFTQNGERGKGRPRNSILTGHQCTHFLDRPPKTQANLLKMNLCPGGLRNRTNSMNQSLA